MELTPLTKVTIPATHFGMRASIKEGRGVILRTVNPTGLAQLEGGQDNTQPYLLWLAGESVRNEY